VVKQWCWQIPALVPDLTDVRMDTVPYHPLIVLISHKMPPVRQASPSDVQTCLVLSRECLVLLSNHALVPCLVV
jgi:hypothetical protein